MAFWSSTWGPKFKRRSIWTEEDQPNSGQVLLLWKWFKKQTSLPLTIRSNRAGRVAGGCHYSVCVGDPLGTHTSYLVWELKETLQMKLSDATRERDGIDYELA